MRSSIIIGASRSISHTRPSISSSSTTAAPSSHLPSNTSRSYTTTSSLSATPLPITATGPPPPAPEPSSTTPQQRIERKRKQAELLQRGKELRAAAAAPSGSATPKTSPLRKRFWKDVFVKRTPDTPSSQTHNQDGAPAAAEGLKGYQVYLDARPVRTPSKTILTVPMTKPHLAHAIAIEWDLLTSAQQALKNHNIPMTSIVSRAQDILECDAQNQTKIREDLLKVLMRYFETDTLLCWAPEKSAFENSEGGANSGIASSLAMDMERTGHAEMSRSESLRSIQQRTAKEIISYLTTTIWPGVEIQPVLDESSILPRRQSDVTRSIVSGWIMGLPAYELAALERAVLASKSLLIGTRLVVEWSEEFRDYQSLGSEEKRQRFGIEEAAEASTLEVRWQTGMWGEVEDTHDVDKEDVRRQLGSVILVVSGLK